MKTTPCTEDVYDFTFNKAPRCGAKTRVGTPCKAPAVRFKKRCRMHGGAKGTGAPLANKNAFKHGYTTSEMKTERAMIKMAITDFKELKKQI